MAATWVAAAWVAALSAALVAARDAEVSEAEDVLAAARVVEPELESVALLDPDALACLALAWVADELAVADDVELADVVELADESAVEVAVELAVCEEESVSAAAAEEEPAELESAEFDSVVAAIWDVASVGAISPAAEVDAELAAGIWIASGSAARRDAEAWSRSAAKPVSCATLTDAAACPGASAGAGGMAIASRSFGTNQTSPAPPLA